MCLKEKIRSEFLFKQSMIELLACSFFTLKYGSGSPKVAHHPSLYGLALMTCFAPLEALSCVSKIPPSFIPNGFKQVVPAVES